MSEEFLLPEINDTVWVEITIPSTLLGTIASSFYKRPELKITYRYADGATETFRYIERMGRSGFLLSPVVHDNNDFLTLHQRGMKSFTRLPVACSISTANRKNLFWSNRFLLRMSALKAAADR